MRLLTIALALCLLPLAAAPVSAASASVEAGPICPYITSLATICVGGSLDCFVSIRVAGGDRYCLP